MFSPSDNKLPLMRFLVLFSVLLGVALSLAALSPAVEVEPPPEPAAPAGE